MRRFTTGILSANGGVQDMAEKKTEPQTQQFQASGSNGGSRAARDFAERLASGGRTFSDSAEIVRADRDSRT